VISEEPTVLRRHGRLLAVAAVAHDVGFCWGRGGGRGEGKVMIFNINGMSNVLPNLSFVTNVFKKEYTGPMILYYEQYKHFKLIDDFHLHGYDQFILNYGNIFCLLVV